MTPVQRIRKYCLMRCQNGHRKLVRECVDTDCFHHPYRMGMRPETFAKQELKKQAR